MKKTVIITGANAGMGKALSMQMAQMGYSVIMACRSEKRGIIARDEVRRESNSKEVELMLCDLASLDSIDAFVGKFLARYDRLDVLINNAGVILTKREETAEGFEMQFGVNHLGHFYLTNRLLDKIKKSPNGRIVNVSSGAHKIGKIDFNDIQMHKKYTAFGAYSRSKLANILFTYELARKLEGSHTTVNCCHPGAVGTSIGIDRKTGFGKGLLQFLSFFFLTPMQGAQTTLYLATSPDVEGVSGQYFYKKRVVQSSKSSHDIALAQQLWDISEKLTSR